VKISFIGVKDYEGKQEKGGQNTGFYSPGRYLEDVTSDIVFFHCYGSGR
jgi:hypothetical protein